MSRKDIVYGFIVASLAYAAFKYPSEASRIVILLGKTLFGTSVLVALFSGGQFVIALVIFSCLAVSIVILMMNAFFYSVITRLVSIFTTYVPPFNLAPVQKKIDQLYRYVASSGMLLLKGPLSSRGSTTSVSNTPEPPPEETDKPERLA